MRVSAICTAISVIAIVLSTIRLFWLFGISNNGSRPGYSVIDINGDNGDPPRDDSHHHPDSHTHNTHEEEEVHGSRRRKQSRKAPAASSAPQPPYIPEWVLKYNVTSFFDWTWHKTGDYDRFKSRISSLSSNTQYNPSARVVNDILKEFGSSQNQDGLIVDNFDQLPNPYPHPLPHSPDFKQACIDLNIQSSWLACRLSPEELSTSMPYTKKFINAAFFNGFIDYGSCHPMVPGTVFTNKATYHFQQWTNNVCFNQAISDTRPLKSFDSLADPLGTYLSAFGHYPNQQFPRLLRLLATIPQDTKIVTAKDGIAGALLEVLAERGVLNADRIVEFQASVTYHARVVYRSEAYPYIEPGRSAHILHDRTDMELVHRVMVDDLDDDERDLVIIIKRDGNRALRNHDQVVEMVNSKKPDHLKTEIFLASGHLREHINLFKKARVVIGPHGAGLINVMWCKKGTDVVEVGYSTGMTLPSMYYEISSHSGQEYWLVRGQGDYGGVIDTNMKDMEWTLEGIFEKYQTGSVRHK